MREDEAWALPNAKKLSEEAASLVAVAVGSDLAEGEDRFVRDAVVDDDSLRGRVPIATVLTDADVNAYTGSFTDSTLPTPSCDASNGWSSENVSATCLGGRHLYKAFLAPLSLPPEPATEVTQQATRVLKPMTPVAEPHPHAAVVAKPSGGVRLALCGNGATGTEEPGVSASLLCLTTPTSPMSELLNLSLFNDLFAEGSAADDKGATVDKPAPMPLLNDERPTVAGTKRAMLPSGDSLPEAKRPSSGDSRPTRRSTREPPGRSVRFEA